jgi:hypothetical protein
MSRMACCSAGRLVNSSPPEKMSITKDVKKLSESGFDSTYRGLLRRRLYSWLVERGGLRLRRRRVDGVW